MNDEAPAAANGLSSEQTPYSVQDFNERLSKAVKGWPNAWVEGELVKFKRNFSGHAYPALKDLNGSASLELTIFAGVLDRATEDFQDGDRVVVSGLMDYYVPSGKISLRVTSIRKVGLGDLLAKLEELRAKLTAEGLIDPSKRKPIPFLPNKIGLITGQNSDAEKDVLTNAQLRWPEVEFRVINTPVQGDGCAPAVVKAIAELDADPEVDVIIIARGGGAFLDLIAFSDETILRAAAAASTPIVSAIGHENDRPLLDDVADLRASTPTDAAKRVVPDIISERAFVAEALVRMGVRLNHWLDNQASMISQLKTRPVLANPFAFLDDSAERLERTVDDLRIRVETRLERSSAELALQAQALRNLSPQGTLDRGYSVVRNADGTVLVDASKVAKGSKIQVRLAKGELNATAD
ncbi:MAG: exodeoxyribonuclease VII large subunit [Phenylobacterium zucineum]|nr:MAG: exodeoxyribonuclease VII large subunit [Phenylobacterium zucineum]